MLGDLDEDSRELRERSFEGVPEPLSERRVGLLEAAVRIEVVGRRWTLGGHEVADRSEQVGERLATDPSWSE